MAKTKKYLMRVDAGLYFTVEATSEKSARARARKELKPLSHGVSIGIPGGVSSNYAIYVEKVSGEPAALEVIDVYSKL